MTASLVILLHGVGARGADLAPLGNYLAAHLPGTAIETPDGPQPFDRGGNGRQWFSVSGVTEVNRPARVEAARPAFDGVVSALMERHGLSGHPDRVALVGFSQGSIMALDAVATGRWPVAGVVAFSGRLPAGLGDSPAVGTPVLMIHGSADPIMPVAESLRAEKLFTAAGGRAETRVIPGLGHGISPEGAAWAADFLSGVLGPAA